MTDNANKYITYDTLKFKSEIAGVCCASDYNLFLKAIRTFNSCFQITSYGATEIAVIFHSVPIPLSDIPTHLQKYTIYMANNVCRVS
ncbi:ATP-dependent DNA helicase [Aphis craccivora]|uniref:ATP-dependent DNA helicase n=1 Tax=Aphis craccivora TaxID=307492 RepID=A0A6G0ZIW5_APHCR|nr:ATP-dependent DNA helicase [Aphis craccivora]